jgi:hypothetical protein
MGLVDQLELEALEEAMVLLADKYGRYLYRSDSGSGSENFWVVNNGSSHTERTFRSGSPSSRGFPTIRQACVAALEDIRSNYDGQQKKAKTDIEAAEMHMGSVMPFLNKLARAEDFGEGEPDLLTPEEWCDKLGLKILDADGWGPFTNASGSYGARPYNEPIDRREFEARFSVSTGGRAST